MIKTNNISRSYRHANNLEYQGVLGKYQTESTVKYQTTEDILKYQNLLYSRAMFGLGVYSHDEIRVMPPDKRKRIIRVHKHTKKVLNLWKQELIITLSDHIFKTLFPNMPLSQDLVNNYREDSSYHCDIDLKKLGITKKDIISKLLEERILPQNVFNLNPT